MATTVAIMAGRAEAINPNRTLSQALLRKWQVQQGLPQATIFSIRQTTDGYLWLGSQSGLIGFDGTRFSLLPDEQGVLENAWIEDLCEDAEGNLWIATDGAGLIQLKRDGTIARFGRSDGLLSEELRCLYYDRSGNLWIGASAGAARFRAGRFETLAAPEGDELRDVWTFGETPDGTIWIGGDGNRLRAFRDGELSSHRLEALPAYGSVRALLGAPDGTLWIGTTNSGLLQLKENRERCFTRAEGLADDWVCCLTAAPDGVLWVGTKDGFSRIRGEEIESFRTRDGLSQSTVYTLCEDREGTLWVGTKHGLNQFIDRRTVPFTFSEGLPSNDTGPVFQDRRGTVWVGTLGAGLARFDGRRFSKALTAKQGLAGNTILSLAGGDRDELWIGTDRGLSCLRGGQLDGAFSKRQGLPGEMVTCLCRDDQGVLWAGTEAGLAEFRDGQFATFPDAPRQLQGRILALAACKRGLFVTAEGGGAYRFGQGQFAPAAGIDATSRDVLAVYCDAEGLLWLGTRGGGLILLDGDRTFTYSIRDGLYDDDIFGIVADNDEHLWMACSKGIFSVSRDELLAFASGAIPNVASTPFSPTDALRTIECQDGIQPAVWKMDDGRIWFSTIRGLLLIDPAHLRRTLPPAAVVVEEVKVNGKQEPLATLGRLPPGQANLDFRYTALSFVSPTRITFRYQLEGFDRDWIEAGARREAFYTNLPPGDYCFRVMACNVDGAWHEAPEPVRFAVEPHFYQTRWFLPLAAFAAALGVWGAYRMRVRRIRTQLNAVLAERSRIARELHDTLMQGFSGVTMEMQALAARLAPSRERGTLEEIIRDAGVCLREARRSVAGLRSAPGEESGLAGAVAQAARQLTETHDVRLKLRLAEAPARLPSDVEYNLLRIAQEAISNAVAHSDGNVIEVALEPTAQGLRLTISDDGVGFRPHDGETARSGHYGLIGMRERASQIGAELRLISEPGRGTMVKLELPLSAAPTAATPPASHGVGAEASPVEPRAEPVE